MQRLPRSVDLLWALRAPCKRGCRCCSSGTSEEQSISVTDPEQASHLSRNGIAAAAAVAFARSLDASAVRRVFLVGNEPLAWTSTLAVIAALKGAGVHVVVGTDGAALSRTHVVRALLDLGVDAVSVYLDSSETFYADTWRPPLNGHDAWHRVAYGIRMLMQARGDEPMPRIGLCTTITRLNLTDVTGVPELAAELGCDYAVPQPISLADDHPLFETLTLTPDDVSELRAQYDLLRGRGLPLGLPGEDFPARVLSAVAHPTGLVSGCFGGRSLYYIDPDGSVWDCPSALKISATPPEQRRSIHSASGGDLFPASASPPRDCTLFSTGCVSVWPLAGFGQLAELPMASPGPAQDCVAD